MNKKKLLPILIIVLIIAVAIPLYVFVLSPAIEQGQQDNTDKRGSDGEMLNASGRPFIVDPMDEDKISVLKVTNANGGFEFYRAQDGQLYLRGAEQHLYNLELQKQLYANAATYLLAIEKLEQHEPLETYGLTPEQAGAIVELTDTDGNYYKIYFGDKLATDAGYYAKREGRDAVYVVDTLLESVLFNTTQDFITPLMVPVLDNNDYSVITDFSLAKDGEPFVAFERLSADEEAQSMIYGIYKMTYPTQYSPSSDNLSHMLGAFLNFTADKTLEYDITDEKLAYYGFTTGTKYEVSYTVDDVEYQLKFSGKTRDNTYYVYSPLFDIIAEISADKVLFLDWDLIKFVDHSIFMINIDNIAGIDIRYPGGSLACVLTGKGDELKVTCNSQLVDTTNFRYFYRSLLSIVIDGYETQPEGAPPYLTMTLTLQDGQTLAFDFYEVGSLKAFFTLNGKGEFYVHRDHLRTMINNISKLLSGETIE